MMMMREVTNNMFGSAFMTPSKAIPDNETSTASATETKKIQSPRSENDSVAPTITPTISSDPISQFASQLNPKSAIGLNTNTHVYDSSNAEAGARFLANQGFNTQLQLQQQQMDQALVTGVLQRQLKPEEYADTRMYGPATNYHAPVGLGNLS